MSTKKGMDLLKRTISVLMLLAVYAIISLTGILSFILAGIVTPIFYFISIRVSGISYERVKDFITSTLIFCFFSFVMQFVMESIIWEWKDFSILSMMMYLLGSSIYYILHLVHMKKRNDSGMGIFPVILLFVIYILINVIAAQIFVDNDDVIMYLLTVTVMAVVITLIYFFLTRHVFGINIEGETFIFLSVDFIYFIVFLFFDDSFGGVRAILQVVMYPFIYLTGKGVYFILYNERKSRINGGCNEEESKGVDEDLKEE